MFRLLGERYVYETVALPAELRRREAGKTLHPAALHTSGLERHYECLANFPQRNALGSLTERGLEALDRFAERLEAGETSLSDHRVGAHGNSAHLSARQH
jgi:hypothetical protein